MKSSLLSLPVIIASSLCLVSQASQAAVIVGYAFDSSSFASTASDTNAIGGGFTFGGGFSGGTGMSTSGGDPAPAPFIRSSVTTEAVGTSSSDYVSLTVNPAVGFQLNLTSLSFDFSFESQGGVTVPAKSMNVVLRSSIDGYAANIGSANSKAATASVSFVNGSFSLNTSGFQSLSGPVEFRLYLTDDSTLASDVVRLDNLMLNGTVDAIPEPSGMILGTLGLAGMVWKRRRK